MSHDVDSTQHIRGDELTSDVPPIGQRFNRPRIQLGMVGFTLLSLVLVGASIRVMLLTPISSDPWQAGILALALGAVGYVVVIGLLLWAQREVEVKPRTVTFRRWTDVFRGRDELSIPVDQLRVGKEGGILLFAVPGRLYRLWIAYWPEPELQGLTEALSREGVTIQI
jgi:hypothetical protein